MRAALAAMVVLAGMGPSANGEGEPAIAASVAAAANAFLASLDAAQREKAVFEFEDAERHNWHFIPKKRLGLPIKEMKAGQQQLALAAIESALTVSRLALVALKRRDVGAEIRGPSHFVALDDCERQGRRDGAAISGREPG